MVAYGERLCFEGAPIIEPPLAQDVAKRAPEVFEGDAIDTELVVPPLTEYERQRVEEAKAVSAESLGKASAEIRTQHDRTLAEMISAKRVCRLSRHRGWSRHGIAAYCCPIWISISTTWALCQLPRCLRTQIGSSAKLSPIH
jgi:hypothetical protein